jgi:two-component system CheB/CheR fusion protein
MAIQLILIFACQTCTLNYFYDQNKAHQYMKSKKQSPKAKADFLLVGIGASAGGIAALKDLFTGLPADTGMAFVVVVHLSQEHESQLHHILQGCTSMKVSQVTESVKVAPDHVYVIPPAKHLEMEDGIIRTTEPERIKGKRIPIDRFFRSMAEAYGQRAISIVLSGSGSDGTLGVKHIKGANGFAIVQDPSDAEFDSMPINAIATGLVDVILPASRMGEKLKMLRKSTEQLHLTDKDGEKVAEEIKGVEALRELLTFLRLRTGHDFTNYKRPTLLRRIARHLQIHEVEGIPDYLEILRQKPEEVHSLIKNLLINVTNFFRDKDTFEHLEHEVIPRLFEDKTSEDQIRVWVAGCASGEEAYSIGILLLEYASRLGDPPRLQIFATDVDDDAINEAKEGNYTEAVIEDVSPERLQQFFTKQPGGYQVKKKLREMVLFAPHNVLRDPPFSRQDLISCRNMLIYFNRDTQEKVMHVFHFALKRNGVLFLGSSESADGVPMLFNPWIKQSRIYLRRDNEKADAKVPQMPIEGRWQVKTAASNYPPNQSSFSTESYASLHHRLMEEYMPASVLINEDYDILHLSERVGRYLRFVGGDPTNNLLKVAHPALRGDLRAMLFSARQNERMESSRPLLAQFNGHETYVTMTAHPVIEADAMKGFMLVLFQESEAVDQPEVSPPTKIPLEESAMETVIRRLEEELQRTKDQLQKIIEQYESSVEELKASNEEQQAINEELRSASEEVETSKEEIQSVNEELTTINHELKDKIEEVSRVNSDLQNLMASTDIGTIFLDRSLNIKRYTPHLQRFFNLISSDVGRPLEHLKHSFQYDNFGEDARKVLSNLQPIEREVKDKEDRSYILRFFPYRTNDDKIDGVVLTFVDITERRKAEQQLRESESQLRAIIHQSMVGIVRVDARGNVLFANEMFLKLMGYQKEDVLNILNLTYPDDAKQSAELFAQLMSNGTPFYHEKRVVRKQGEVLHISVTASAILDANSKPESAVLVVLDITHRKGL